MTTGASMPSSEPDWVLSMPANVPTAWWMALVEGAPWTMVNAPTLPHAFDALDTSDTSRRIVRDTLDFLYAQLDPLPAAPPASAAREILADMYGLHFYRALVKR